MFKSNASASSSRHTLEKGLQDRFPLQDITAVRRTHSYIKSSDLLSYELSFAVAEFTACRAENLCLNLVALQ
jgi:hypothetical protein